MYGTVPEVEGLAAGKPVDNRQYRYTCSKSSPNFEICPAEKNGTQAETERKMVIKRNGVQTITSF